jgi:hypothetical protein
MSKPWDNIVLPVVGDINQDNFTDGALKTNINTNYLKDGCDYLDNLIVDKPNENLLINGDFQVWQKGDSILTDSAGETTTDRWIGQSALVTRQSNDGTLPFNSKNYLRCEVQTTSALRGLQYRFEGIHQINNKTVTLSFWINNIHNDSDLDFQFQLVPSGSIDGTTVSLLNETIPAPAGWTKITRTVTVPNVIDNYVEGGYVRIVLSQGGATVTPADFYLAEIKLEYGSIATPFMPRRYEEELRDCKYYFERLIAGNIGHAFGESTTFATGLIQYTEKRTNPSISISSQTGINLLKDEANADSTAVSFTGLRQSNALLGITTAGDVVENAPSIITLKAGEYIDIDAEI